MDIFKVKIFDKTATNGRIKKIEPNEALGNRFQKEMKTDFITGQWQDYTSVGVSLTF